VKPGVGTVVSCGCLHDKGEACLPLTSEDVYHNDCGGLIESPETHVYKAACASCVMVYSNEGGRQERCPDDDGKDAS